MALNDLTGVKQQFPNAKCEEITKKGNSHKNSNLPLLCAKKDTLTGVLYAPFAVCLFVASDRIIILKNKQ